MVVAFHGCGFVHDCGGVPDYYIVWDVGAAHALPAGTSCASKCNPPAGRQLTGTAITAWRGQGPDGDVVWAATACDGPTI